MGAARCIAMARRAPAAVGFTGRTRPAARAIAPSRTGIKGNRKAPPSFGEAEAPPPLAAAPPSACGPLPPVAALRSFARGLWGASPWPNCTALKRTRAQQDICYAPALLFLGGRCQG